MLVRDGQIECLRPESVRQAAKDRPKPKPRRVGGAQANTSSSGKVDTSDLNKLADEAVKNRGNNQYEIQKDALDAVLRDQQKLREQAPDRKSTRLNSSHVATSYAVFCLKK